MDTQENTIANITKKRNHDTLDKLQDYSQRPTKKTQYSLSDIMIQDLIDNITDIESIVNLPNDKYITHNYTMMKLCFLRKPLKELYNMVGIQHIKNDIFRLIVFFVLKQDKSVIEHKLHTIIEGYPGCGKSKLANIIAHIYSSIRLLSSKDIIYARRSDLIGEYLGHTAIKTQKVIDNSKHKILIIDENNIMSNYDKRDVFSKECISTLNKNLKDKQNDFTCIIVSDVNSNDSHRHINFTFSIKKYSNIELAKMFTNKLLHDGYDYSFTLNDISLFFQQNPLTYYGSDIDRLTFEVYLESSLRQFYAKSNTKNIILKDLHKAYKKLYSK